jgi:hypothetical protein
MMNDIMVDLETMDNVPSAAIVSIGAVQCNLITGELGEEYYRVVDLKGQKGTINPETLYWWMGQSDSARQALLVEGKVPIVMMLAGFNSWLKSLSSPEKLKLWGNGASFDNAIIRQTYRYYDMELPIPFWNDRDMRTIVGFYPRQLQEKWRRTSLRKGTHHNALDDAKQQVVYCSHILQELGVKELY